MTPDICNIMHYVILYDDTAINNLFASEAEINI